MKRIIKAITAIKVYAKSALGRAWERWCEHCMTSENIEQVVLIGLVVFCSVMILLTSIWNMSLIGFVMGIVCVVVSSRTFGVVWREYKSQKQ